MRPPGPAFRLFALAVVLLGPVLPAAAGSTPEPVADPYGLVVPMPGCGMAGRVVTAPRLHPVRLAAPGPRRGRQQVRHAVRPPTPAPAPADSSALAWQAFYGCAAAVPEEAGVTAGARPLRPT